jgi:hypothetical protein
MVAIRHRELRNETSRVLRAVHAGETFEVTTAARWSRSSVRQQPGSFFDSGPRRQMAVSRPSSGRTSTTGSVQSWTRCARKARHRFVYVDTSAAAKVLVEEAESAALADRLDVLVNEGHALLSSRLLETELRRLAVREGLDQSAVTEVIARVDLYEPPRSVFHEAGLLPGPICGRWKPCTLPPLRVEVSVVVTYDDRQAAAARSLGLPVESP